MLISTILRYSCVFLSIIVSKDCIFSFSTLYIKVNLHLHYVHRIVRPNIGNELYKCMCTYLSKCKNILNSKYHLIN